MRVLGAIRKILSHIREANLDVPFVAMNRSHDFLSEGLTQRDVWTIFNLDQEYAKYRAQYITLRDSLQRILKAVREHSTSPQPVFVKQLEILARYHKALEESIQESQSLEFLKNYQPIIMFLKNFYKVELDSLDAAEGVHKRAMPSMRGQYDEL